MSTDKRVTFNEHGEPVVTVTILGWDDAFRLSWALAHLQCDFADVGRRIGSSLRRKLGAVRWREMHARYSSGPVEWARDAYRGVDGLTVDLDAVLAEMDRHDLDIEDSYVLGLLRGWQDQRTTEDTNP